MSSPARCDHNRIHRDSADIGRHNECRVPDPFSTPAPTTRRLQTSRAPKGRGRPRKQAPISPAGTLDFEDNSGFPSSPLGPFSHRPPRSIGAFGSPVDPQETQVESLIDGEDTSAVMDSLPSPSSSAAAPFQDALEHTPGGTSFIRETPLLDVSAGGVNSEPDSSILADQREPASTAKQDTDAANTQQWEHDAIQMGLEIDHLRRSRAVVVEELENSTALVNRLQVRRRVLEATAMITNVLLGQTQCDREAADDDAREARRHAQRVKRHLGSLLLLVLFMIVAYILWCWHKAPEMEYIRQRREAVLHE